MITVFRIAWWTPRTVAAAAPGLAIPGFGFGVSDTVNVSKSFTLSDVDIRVQITDAFVGDLVIEVERAPRLQRNAS